MAWPPARANGFVIDATAWNAVVAALSAWGGTVNAGGNDLGNLGNLFFASGKGFTSAITITGSTSPLLRVTRGASGIAPTANATQIFVENTGGGAYVETAVAAVGDSCGYLFSAGSSLTSYIIDINSQWLYVSTRPVVFNLGGAERMRITAAGAIGIGILDPQVPLHVTRTVTQPAPPAAGTFGGTAIFGNLTSGYGMYIGTISSGAGYIQQQRGDSAVTYPLFLQPNGGNAGIGIFGALTPAAPLHVIGSMQTSFSAASDIGGQVNVGNGSYQWKIIGNQLVGGDFMFRNPAGENVIYFPQTGGKIGIGTVAPFEHVSIVPAATATTIASAYQFSVCEGTNNSVYRLLLGYYVNGGVYTGAIQAVANGPAAGVLLLQPQGGKIGIGMESPGYVLQLAVDSAAKPSANWTVVSDVRTKCNMRPYTDGLETLLRLRPTAFEYNGEADMPDGMEAVGLVAQEAAEVIPSCVRRARGVIAGEETDVLALNTSDLTWMMLNALRELDARLREAERKTS